MIPNWSSWKQWVHLIILNLVKRKQILSFLMLSRQMLPFRSAIKRMMLGSRELPKLLSKSGLLTCINHDNAKIYFRQALSAMIFGSSSPFESLRVSKAWHEEELFTFAENLGRASCNSQTFIESKVNSIQRSSNISDWRRPQRDIKTTEQNKRNHDRQKSEHPYNRLNTKTELRRRGIKASARD